MAIKNDISEALNMLAQEGFNLVSTNTQVLQGTFILDDTKSPDVQYGIYGKSGYVRKRNKKSPMHPMGFPYGDNRWWQLNKCVNTPIDSYWGRCYAKERVLIPNDYVGMAEIVIRVAKKSRK